MQSFFPLPVFILSVQIDKIVLADITLTNKGNNKDSELSGDSIYKVKFHITSCGDTNESYMYKTFTCNVFLFLFFLLFEILQLPRGVCGWYSYPWDLGKTAWGGPSKRRVSTIQEELSVIDDAGAYFVLGGGGG